MTAAMANKLVFNDGDYTTGGVRCGLKHLKSKVLHCRSQQVVNLTNKYRYAYFNLVLW